MSRKKEFGEIVKQGTKHEAPLGRQRIWQIRQTRQPATRQYAL